MIIYISETQAYPLLFDSFAHKPQFIFFSFFFFPFFFKESFSGFVCHVTLQFGQQRYHIVIV